MGAAVRYKTTNVPRQQSELARMKVVRGPDSGATYVVTGPKATIGRGEDNDIVISDLKSSRNHCELVLTQSGWIVRDLGSANGILHNGRASRTGNLNSKDTITVGETVLEFLASDQATMMLMAPVRSLEQIQSEQSAFETQKRRVRAMGLPGGGLQAPAAQQKKDPKKLLVYGIILAGAAFMLLGPDEKSGKKIKQSPKKDADSLPTGADLERYLPGAEGAPMVAKSADVFFRNGFREYRERNWLRAKLQFETVLQMSPGHSLARLYLSNCENQIKDEVRSHLEHGKKDFDAGKLKDAKGHFEAILRLLYRDPTNPSHIEASEQLDKVVKEMRAEVMR